MASLDTTISDKSVFSKKLYYSVIHYIVITMIVTPWITYNIIGRSYEILMIDVINNYISSITCVKRRRFNEWIRIVAVFNASWKVLETTQSHAICTREKWIRFMSTMWSLPHATRIFEFICILQHNVDNRMPHFFINLPKDISTRILNCGK